MMKTLSSLALVALLSGCQSCDWVEAKTLRYPDYDLGYWRDTTITITEAHCRKR